jgi:hypothetical protein
MSWTIDTAAAGNNPEAEARMSAAFGPNWRNNIDQIQTTVKDMRNKKLNIADANPQTFDREEKAKSGVSVTLPMNHGHIGPRNAH